MAASLRPIGTDGVADQPAAILARVPILAQRAGAEAARRDAERELPFEAFAQLREAGIGTLRVPRAAGGPGGTIADVIAAIAGLAEGDANVAHGLRSHFNLLEIAVASPQAANRGEIFEQALAGRLFAAAHTELGTDRPGQITTRLVGGPGRWRLVGRKYYATGAAFADLLSVSALADDGEPRRVLVPTDRAGVRVLDDWDGMGQRLTSSGSVVFENVEVRDDEVGVRSNDGLVGRHASTFRQLFLAAVQAGIVRALRREARDYVTTRARPITHGHAETARDDLFVQQAVGRIAAAAHAVDVLVADAAARLDRTQAALVAGHPDIDALLSESALAVAKAQSVIGAIALEAAQTIFDTGGASATSRALNYDRHWRNIRTLLSHNPVAYKQQVIGDHELNGRVPPTDGGFF